MKEAFENQSEKEVSWSRLLFSIDNIQQIADAVQKGL